MTTPLHRRRNRLNWCGSALRHESRRNAALHPRHRYSGLKKSKHESVRGSTARLQRSARERADDEAPGSPGSACLILKINTSTGRSSTYGFARSWRLKTAYQIGWLRFSTPVFRDLSKLKERSHPKQPRPGLFHFRLEDWIDEHIFGFAKQEGSFFAITYYGIRDPRYQRAEVCWSECTEKWKKAKPIQYPSFEEWKALAAQCD